jgi:hypothetical protein
MVALLVGLLNPFEEDFVGMSPEAVAGLYVVLVGGVLAVLGMIAIASVERYLRRRGKVRLMAWDGELTFLHAGPPEKAVFSFEAYLFNARPLSTKLRAPSVAFFRDDVQVAAGSLRDSVFGDESGALNLPPWWEGRVSLYALFEGEQARALTGSLRVEFVCRLSGGMFGRKIGGRKDFVADQKKFGTTRKDFVAGRKKSGIVRKDFAARRKRLGASRKDFASGR